MRPWGPSTKEAEMALKSALAAGLVALTMAFVPGAPAEAKTRVHIGIGSGPFVDYCWTRGGRHCGWRPRPHHFYYVPHHRPLYFYGYDYRYDHRRPVARKMSCRAAANLVDHSGYNHVRTSECRGEVYTFRARKKGHNYIVKVNAFTHRIIGVGRT
jgi:hypothetical protein